LAKVASVGQHSIQEYTMRNFHNLIRVQAFAAALALLAIPLHAHEHKAGDLEIGHPWTRATPAGAKVAGGYLKVTNHGKTADRLIGFTAEGAGAVELHEMAMADNVMTMREVKGGLEIKPGETVELAPGGYHIMMMGLTAPFKQGQVIKGTLKFEHAGTVPIEYMVEAMGAKETAGGHGDHGEHGDHMKAN
jgi:copper(I)-binding protein